MQSCREKEDGTSLKVWGFIGDRVSALFCCVKERVGLTAVAVFDNEKIGVESDSNLMSGDHSFILFFG